MCRTNNKHKLPPSVHRGTVVFANRTQLSSTAKTSPYLYRFISIRPTKTRSSRAQRTHTHVMCRTTFFLFFALPRVCGQRNAICPVTGPPGKRRRRRVIIFRRVVYTYIYIYTLFGRRHRFYIIVFYVLSRAYGFFFSRIILCISICMMYRSFCPSHGPPRYAPRAKRKKKKIYHWRAYTHKEGRRRIPDGGESIRTRIFTCTTTGRYLQRRRPGCRKPRHRELVSKETRPAEAAAAAAGFTAFTAN